VRFLAEKKGKMISVAAEFPGFSDIFKFMFIDHDCDDIGIDTECFYEGTGKLFNDCAFLFKGKSFSHFEDYYGHGLVHRYPELWVKPVFSMKRYEIVYIPDTAD